MACCSWDGMGTCPTVTRNFIPEMLWVPLVSFSAPVEKYTSKLKATKRFSKGQVERQHWVDCWMNMKHSTHCNNLKHMHTEELIPTLVPTDVCIYHPIAHPYAGAWILTHQSLHCQQDGDSVCNSVERVHSWQTKQKSANLLSNHT